MKIHKGSTIFCKICLYYNGNAKVFFYHAELHFIVSFLALYWLNFDFHKTEQFV